MENWYDMWMKQSKSFFEASEKNLKEIFESHDASNEKMQQWVEMLRNQCQFTQVNEQQKAFAEYWQFMAKMYNDACDLFMKQWMQRKQEDNPLKNARELYELWLNCCHEVYEQAMRTKEYQSAYGEFLNTAMKYWKNVN